MCVLFAVVEYVGSMFMHTIYRLFSRGNIFVDANYSNYNHNEKMWFMPEGN